MTNFLIVKLAAAGDALLTTALLAELRRAQPHSHIGWLVSDYAAPLLEANPDLDDRIAVALPRAGAPLAAWAARAAAAARWLPPLRRWRRAHPQATVLLAHRAPALRRLLRLAGFHRIVSFDPALWHPGRSRLQWQADLLRSAGVVCGEAARFAPRLCLSPAEIAAGERVWDTAADGRPRWAIAPGGAVNPWAAMPNRRWPKERFLELAQRALAGGIALRWFGGAADAPTLDWIAERLPGGPAQNRADHFAGRLPLRATAAALAAADLVIGNDSLPLVMAAALRRPGLGLYGPTAGALVHAPGQPYLQGLAGCGPCYDPGAGLAGQAYRCPRPRCMEQISVDEVWRLGIHWRGTGPLRGFAAHPSGAAHAF